MTSTNLSTEARLALDARGLDRLKLQSRERPDEALRSAAKQFEAVFMNTLLKSMRDALPSADPLSSNDSKLYKGMLDQELANRFADRGIGIADVLVRQLGNANKGRVNESPNGKPIETLTETGTATGQPKAAPPNTTGAPLHGFVRRLMPEARATERETGVPAEFMLGQAALESAWGQREIRRPDGATTHNLFGIKAGRDWKGATVDVSTTEYVDGVARGVVDKFRAYASYAEAFQDYGKLVANSPRYAAAMKRTDSVEGYANGLQQGGYATDPRYAEKLTRVINQAIAITRSGSRSA